MATVTSFVKVSRKLVPALSVIGLGRRFWSGKLYVADPAKLAMASAVAVVAVGGAIKDYVVRRRVKAAVGEAYEGIKAESAAILDLREAGIEIEALRRHGFDTSILESAAPAAAEKETSNARRQRGGIEATA